MLWFFIKPRRWRLFIDELEFVGNQSLGIIILTSAFTGAVLAFQGYLALSLVGTESLVGTSTCLSLVRELAPVMTAIVVAGRAGAAMAAKIGIMRVSQQIDALEVMAISPKQYLVSPKIYAAIIAVPLLTAIFSLVGNLGGYIVGVLLCGIDSGIYIQKMREFFFPMDLYHGLIKAACFGFIITSISCYKGYVAKNGAEGVGSATNESVVYSIVVVLVVDYFLSVLIPTGVLTQ